MSNDSSCDLPRGNQRVEVITSIQRRRRWAPAEKKAMVEETYEPGHSVSYVARKHGIAPSQLFAWKKKMEAGALTAVGSEERVVPESDLKQAQERIKRLERLLGKRPKRLKCSRKP
jgi:transposase